VRLKLAWHIALALLAGVAVAATVGLALWFALGRPSLHPRQRGLLNPSEIYDGIKIALTVVAGIGGVIALVVAYRRQRLAEREHVRAEDAAHREDTRLYTDRFGRAADQLGSDKAAVRLAGAYAMAELADDWDDSRQVCIDVLCAYLRMPYIPPPDAGVVATTPRRTHRQYGAVAKPSRRPDPESEPAIPERDPHEERQVRHTVIRLIANHLRAGAAVAWRGHDFDFTDVVFDGGSFGGAEFTGGEVSFTGARFTGGKVSFNRVRFTSGRVSFSGAQFISGHVYFSGAEFAGGRVSFSGARFAGSDVYFGGAEFTGTHASFHRAQFAGGHVSFRGAAFTGGDVSFHGARFTGGEVSFDRAQFTGGQVHFRAADFGGGEVSFHRAEFTGGHVSFNRAQFTGGRVQISEPLAYLQPPTFDHWSGGPPVDLQLPVEPNGTSRSVERQGPRGA
jgi:uncharacterized protein YjbI with pentapeptide repeats